MQEWGETRQDSAGNNFGTLGSGMNAVLLDGARDVDQIFIDHGNEGDVVLCREIAKDLVERLNVVGAIIGRKSDAGEEHLDVRGFEGGKDDVEILEGLFRGEATKAIIASEFDDDKGRMALGDCVYAGGCVFGGGTAGTTVLDLVFVATLVEVALECVRKGLARLESVSGGDAVAVANDGGTFGGGQRK